MPLLQSTVSAIDTSAASTEATTVQAVGAATGPAGDPAAAVEAADETAGASAVGRGKPIGMRLAPAVAGEAALGLLAGCATAESWSGTKSWLSWEWAVLGRGVNTGRQKSGVVMT